MLRLAVIVLLLANAGYYAWTQGLLKSWGLGPEEQSEPERMHQQIRPETLQILRGNGGSRNPPTPPPPAAPAPAPAPAPASASASASAAAAAPAAEPAECLQAGVFDERQAEALRSVIAQGLPQGSWQLEPTPVPGRWMVYMGRFDDLEALEKKRTELRVRRVEHDRAGGTLEYGLSLGRFSTREAAERELADLASRNVRTARVLQERPATTGYTLRLPAATPALRTPLDSLVARGALAGKALRAC